MKYEINITMVYDFDIHIIKIKGEEERYVRLSKPASRLLYELIANNNVVLKRNYLIYNVWERYGHKGSDISLNVAISEIRKAFRQLNGDPMIIKTLRKVGFMLSAHIDCLDAEFAYENDEKANTGQQSQNSDGLIEVCILLAGLALGGIFLWLF